MTESHISRVALVGFGTLGRVIGYHCIMAGYPTAVFDIQSQSLRQGAGTLKNWLALAVDEGRLSKGNEEKTMEKFIPCDSLAECLKDTDLVIEVVQEKPELKRQVFSEMDRLAPAEAILASNTSSFHCSLLAEATARPEKVIVIHFSVDIHHPVADVKWSTETSDDTIRAAVKFVETLNLIPFLSMEDIVGFPFNRIWRAIKRESLHLVGEEQASYEDIDRLWMHVYNCAFGPFGLMDMVGLDTVRNVEMMYYRISGNEQDKPPQFLEDMIAKGHLGVKTGRGFYSYPEPDYKQGDWLCKRGNWRENLEAVLAARKK